MESEKVNQKSNPKENANPLSSLFFCWTLPLFMRGNRKDLEMEDIYTALKKDESKRLGDVLEMHFMQDVEACKLANSRSDDSSKKKPSLAKALFKTFWKEITFLGILVIFNEIVFKLANPIVLGKLLEYFRPETTVTKTEALYYASGIVLLNGGSALFMNHYMVGCFHMGMRARVAVCSLIYRKSLKLSQSALGESSPGKVVNLLSNDVNRFDLVSIFLHYLWMGPFVSLVAFYFLYQNVGASGILGIIVVFTVMPLQSYTGKLSSRFRLQTAMKTDERVRLMGEIIYGVQVIKMYTWEKPFQIIVSLARKLEINVIRKNSYVRAVYMSFLLITNRVAMFSTLVALYFSGMPLSSARIFVVAAYLNILSHTMSAMFVRAIAEIAEAMVAMQRLQKYMMQDEFVSAKSSKNLLKEKKKDMNGKNDKYIPNGDVIEPVFITPDEVVIKISNIESKWCSDSVNLTLKIDDLQIKRGNLIGIIGPIGSGKSSLLQLILGELPALAGYVNIDSTISYACQEPWVFGASLKQNILFGLPYEKERYDEVVRVCALLKDFQQFPFGDETIVGERGASLSGGQKARINLARSVYRQTNTYLLDDPLSAVDTHVGRHLFDECIMSYLKSKTRILVTHQLHYLKDADYIIVLKDGKIQMQGTFQEVTSSSIDFASMLVPVKEEGTESTVDLDEVTFEGRTRSFSKSPSRIMRRKNSSNSQRTQRSASLTSSIAELGEISNFPGPTMNDDEEEVENSGKGREQTIHSESSSKNKVKGSVGLNYLTSGGSYLILFIIFLLFALAQTFASACDYWMAFWISQEELRSYQASMNDSFANLLNDSASNNTDFSYSTVLPLNSENFTLEFVDEESLEKTPLSSNLCMIVYGSFCIGLIIISFIRSISFYSLCMRSSQKLHDMMFRGIIRSPMRFFNVNPSGRIMNRFSKDMGAVDELLPKAFMDSSQIILQMVGAITLTCIVNPIFLLPIAVLAVIFLLVRKGYLRTSKNIKRLEGMARSPVFTHLSATLSGLPTIRAYSAQNIVRDEFDRYQDTHTAAWYLFITTSSAFGLFLDALCLSLVAFVTFSFLLISSEILGDKVGLAITQSMTLTFMMQWGIRQSAEVANQFMAVERVLEYTQLEPENGIAADEIDIKNKTVVFEQQKHKKKPHKDWPEEGAVHFNNLYMKYSNDKDSEFVLNGLNCKIKPSEKIGIVGRTGAGKSSLISAIFRLAYNTGQIVIDNINSEDITLEDLRKKISIIPQDPVLFSGTLRRNLDPFEEYSDSKLWDALQQVELKDAITGPAGLESRVMDGGSNFSIGQRQLICLARAILRSNRILVLDEATANVDPYTDALIQKTIRHKFVNCTVLTVAHRLNTIMDSDKVLVMSRGQVIEFNHPYLLLRDESGTFYQMCMETGKQNFKVLYESAKNAYLEKQFQIQKDTMKMIDD